MDNTNVTGRLRFPIIINKIREEGVYHYCRIFFQKTRKLLIPRFRTTYIFESIIDEHPQIKYSEDFEIQVISHMNEMLREFARIRGPWYIQQAETLFSSGNVCFVAINNGKIVSCLWTSYKIVHLTEIEYKLTVADNIVPLIDGFTIDEFRGKGIYKILWEECNNYHFKQGTYSKIYGFINPVNKRSMKVHEKLNLNKIIIVITMMKIFGIKMYFKRKIT
jgi:RimJ/RimL family protein N-acetyltransferase